MNQKTKNFLFWVVVFGTMVLTKVGVTVLMGKPINIENAVLSTVVFFLLAMISVAILRRAR